MALTDLKIRKAKPREKPYKIYDSLGLFVLVNPNGSKRGGRNTRKLAKSA